MLERANNRAGVVPGFLLTLGGMIQSTELLQLGLPDQIWEPLPAAGKGQKGNGCGTGNKQHSVTQKTCMGTK